MIFPYFHFGFKSFDGGSFGLFIERYGEDRSGSMFRVYLWPEFFIVQFGLNVPEGGHFDFYFGLRFFHEDRAAGRFNYLTSYLGFGKKQVYTVRWPMAFRVKKAVSA